MSTTKRYDISFKWILLSALGCVLQVSGCKKFVEIDPPVNEIISDEIFKNDGLAISAVTGMYSDMMSSNGKFSSGELTFYVGMSADELVFQVPNNNRDEFIKNDISKANPVLLSAFWESSYRLIYTANICLEKMYAPSAQISDSTKRMLDGECRFIRAFCFFQLVNLFGAMPMPLQSDFEINQTLGRSSINEIYSQIIQDLGAANELLKEKYPSAEKVRPNKWTVMALLAKVYLYRNEWAKAEAATTQIISSTLYSLEPLNSVFLKGSKEAIWQLLPVNATFNNTWEGNALIPPSTSYLLSDTLWRSFESNDQRKQIWVSSKNVSGIPRPYPAKYKIKTNTDKLEYYMVFRLAEQYLIRAEARAHLNKLTEAAEDLNLIRNRANLPNTLANTQSTLYSAIAQERKIELFAEWGNRWFDLKRTQRADLELKDLSYKKSTWSQNDTLWPIPSSQIAVNPNLTQNPGY